MPMDLSSLAPGATDPEVLLADNAHRVGAPDRRELVRIFLVLLAFTFVLRLPAFFTPVFNSDETFLATQAHVLNDGGQLYQDAIDRKPPIVPYVYAATFTFFETTALWSVRVVAMLAVALTALLLAIEARRRYGARAGWIAGILFVVAMVTFMPQDGQAANFEVFMLPSMTAAILFARRGRGFLAGVAIAAATLAKQTGAATLLPVVYLIARQAREARRRPRCSLGFTIPTALVALAMGPVAAPLLDRAGQRLLRRHEDDDHGRADPVPLHDRHVDPVQPAAALEDPERVEGPQARRARRRARHRPVAVDRCRRRCRWRSACASSATTTCSWSRRWRCWPPARSSRGSRGVGPARGRVRAGGRLRVLGRRLLLPSGRAGAELRVGVALPRHHHQPRRPDLRVGQRARDLLGVGPSPGDAVPHVVVPHRQLPGPTAEADANTGDDTEAAWEDFYRTSPRTRRSTSSTRHRRRCAARSTTRSPTSRASSTSSTRSTSTSSPSTASTSTSASSAYAQVAAQTGARGCCASRRAAAGRA